MQKTKTKTRHFSRWMTLFSLIFAGEMIFSLPFHVARFFRPTLLESFSLTNTQLGDTFALYGIIAMICYFPGGVLADYFSARKLLTFSLLSTAIGGLFFAQIPQGMALSLLFGYWGLTTILFFWAGMIKATREWGGHLQQGRAFGLLDGGRGLVAALMSSIAVFIFSQFMSPDNSDGIKAIIYFYTFLTFLAGVFLWLFIPEKSLEKEPLHHPWLGMKQAMGSSLVWLQALIVICAYSGFKGADNYGVYAVDVLKMDQLDAAAFTSYAAYLRPVGAIAAGFLADRISASKVIAANFLALVIFYLIIAFLPLWMAGQELMLLALFNLSLSFLAVFALRGVYFALVEESHITLSITGTAVGFISFIGYTPDVFFSSITGRILDAAPGAEGFQNYFIVMMGFAFIGLLAVLFLHQNNKRVNLNAISA